jgi:hypothetical protein
MKCVKIEDVLGRTPSLMLDRKGNSAIAISAEIKCGNATDENGQSTA